MALNKYNPKRVTGSWKGTINGRDFAVRFIGVMDGTFLTAEYDEDATTKHIGSHGDASVVLNANKGAKIVVTLVQGSSANDQLSDLVPDADRDYLPVGVLNWEDLNGGTVIKCQEAWILKMAKIEFGNSITGREWTFDTGNAQIKVGGAEFLA